MGTAKAAVQTETGAGGAGHTAAHPTGAALDAAEGSLVGGDRADQGVGTNNNAGYSPAQTPAADQDAAEGARVSVRPALLSSTA